MIFNEKEGAVKITGYNMEIYQNESGDIVLRQDSPYKDDSIIIIGKEQTPAVIKALKLISSIRV